MYNAHAKNPKFVAVLGWLVFFLFSSPDFWLVESDSSSVNDFESFDHPLLIVSHAKHSVE